jgi:hypothetical protein
MLSNPKHSFPDVPVIFETIEGGLFEKVLVRSHGLIYGLLINHFVDEFFTVLFNFFLASEEIHHFLCQSWLLQI